MDWFNPVESKVKQRKEESLLVIAFNQLSGFKVFGYVRSYFIRIVSVSIAQVNQLDSQSHQTVDTVRTLYVMKSRPLKDTVVSSIYKSGISGAAVPQKKDDLFPDVSGKFSGFDVSWTVMGHTEVKVRTPFRNKPSGPTEDVNL